MAEKPSSPPPPPERRDPDTIVSEQMGEVLEKELKVRQINLSKSECRAVSLDIILHFIRSRALAWSGPRLVNNLGKPNAEAEGFALAILPAVARAGAELGLPFDQPIGKWSKDQVASLLALGYEGIQAQAASVLETDDDIPF